MSISSAATFKLSTFPGNDLATIKEIGTRTFVCFKELKNTVSRSKITSPSSVYTHRLTFANRAAAVHCVRPDSAGNTTSSSLEGVKGKFDDESRVLEIGNGDQQKNDFGGGGGGGGGNEGGGSFGGGDSGEGGNEGDNEDEREFGPILKFEDVMKEANARGVELPSDMLEAAKSNGLRKLFLLRYLDLQGTVWPLNFLIKYCTLLLNRMLEDPSFLFKVGTELVIDSCCATFAEIQKRGKDFWAEFELYLADLLVGIVVDIALGVLYGSVGFGCGLVGQDIANLIMTAKRNIRKSDDDVPVPPLVKSAVLWGVFLGVSSNTRYQIINGLERLVEASPAAKQVPPLAMAFTVGVRFANNIYGGMQFVDWA
ncbi:adaptin family protein [Hibiscus syriacus]|uniref:Adaptin family protein n=1 Tax=Hibiscus syriacus TaxID=106335 RepID=A0A6A2ZNK2_HIBSY|nr:adaptin family protein [Hibiscus syriacus]